MVPRLLLPALCVLCVAQTHTPAVEPASAEPPAPPAAAGRPDSPAYRSWREGQLALEKEEFDKAIGQFQVALRLDPQLAQAHLGLATAYLARGEDPQALPHLERYVSARPYHMTVRAHYAELLFRMDRLAQARGNFERFVVDVQDNTRLADEHLVHCHTRLMEVAEQLDDGYGAHLHRGIGLYHLARQRGELQDPASRELAESLLCKAAAELTLARQENPEAARPCWYLYEVWERLAQRQPARRWLRRTQDCVTLDDLTPVERRNLQLACSKLDEDGRRK